MNMAHEQHPQVRSKRQPRKGLFILPSVFTAANIAAGYYAISQAVLGGAGGDYSHFDHAAQAIGIAIVFDFFDGGADYRWAGRAVYCAAAAMLSCTGRRNRP